MAWYLKCEEDTFLLKNWKKNNGRVEERSPVSKTNSSHILVEVLNVKSCADDASKVEIVFKNLLEKNGKSSLRFDVKDYKFYGSDAFSDQFENCDNGKDFQNIWSTASAPKTPDSLVTGRPEKIVATSSSTSAKRKSTSKSTTPKASKRTLFHTCEAEDLPSPDKKIRPKSQESELESHRLGLFTLKWSSFTEPPKKWVDRPVDPVHVEELVNILKDNPSAMVNGQTWLGIADRSKSQIKQKEDIKGCRITLIGGLHRRKAYEKVSTSEEHRKMLEKVPIQIYDNALTDSQVKRLAALHNLSNVGSRKTTWVERVHACRLWRYELEGTNPKQDEVPQSSHTQWRKDCQKMFVETNKDISNLETTLQTAILPKNVFDLWAEVVQLYNGQKLKGQKLAKPNSSEKKELKQHQLGMPLQGLEDTTKMIILKRVVDGEYTLKEMNATCSSIKKKKKIQSAFCQYTCEKTWEDVVRRFPNHTTESKLAAFTTMKIGRGPLPDVLVNFFKRAILWEKEQEHPAVKLSGERENSQFFERGDSTGILLCSDFGSLSEASLKSLISNFKGFELTVLELTKHVDMDELETVFMKIHALNVEENQHYNVLIILNGAFDLDEEKQVQDIMGKRMHCIQRAYFVDSSSKKPTSQMMTNAVIPAIVGHWSSTGTMQEGNCHGTEAGNAFIYPKEDKDRLPKELLAEIIERFSYPGGWILTKCNGSGVLAALTNQRNCVELTNNAQFRLLSKYLNQAFEMKKDDATLLEETDTQSDGDKECENHYDSNVIITEVRNEENAKQFLFLPVSHHWKKTKSLQMVLPFEEEVPSSQYDRKYFPRETPPTRRIAIRADGNCLFRALSHVITGNEKHHMAVRAYTVQQMREMPVSTFQMISGKPNAELYLRESQMENQCIWGTEIELFVLATFLNVTIFVYVKSGKNFRWLPYHPKGKDCVKHEESIYLINENNHFEVVVHM